MIKIKNIIMNMIKKNKMFIINHKNLNNNQLDNLIKVRDNSHRLQVHQNHKEEIINSNKSFKKRWNKIFIFKWNKVKILIKFRLKNKILK
jgi:hypothetical protein